MTAFKEVILTARDGTGIATWKIIPDKPVAALQLVHGMMEHSFRYLEFARWMADKGIAVYMNDHRGHGKNLAYNPGGKVFGKEVYGHFSDLEGWKKSVETIFELTSIIKQSHPGLPVFILGHSMGSVLVQSYLRKHGHEVRGAVLSGPMLQPRLLLHAGILLVDILRMLHGPRHRSKLLVQLGYGSYSKFFKPSRTDFDWLCSDPSVVDAYLADPYCGFPCTNAFYSDFFRGMRENRSPKLPVGDLPLLIFAGGKDPAGHFGKDPVKIADKYLKAGIKEVNLKLWPEGRHEMLSEVNKAEVWEFVLSWINSVGQLDSWTVGKERNDKRG